MRAQFERHHDPILGRRLRLVYQNHHQPPGRSDQRRDERKRHVTIKQLEGQFEQALGCPDGTFQRPAVYELVYSCHSRTHP